MDTIISYLDNIFASLPATEAVLKAKRELLAIMEEKYRALKSEGKSENEAVGAVISEFGNIDEIIAELGIRRGESVKRLPLLKDDEAYGFIAASRQGGLLIGLGVFLCIAGTAFMLLLASAAAGSLSGRGLARGAGGVIGLIVMFLFIAIGVGLFIYAGLKLERFKLLEKGFELTEHARQEIQRQYERYAPAFTLSIVIGVGLCILSPVPLFLTAVFPGFRSGFAVSLLLLLIAVAVFIFIRAGMTRDAYQRLLQIEDYAPEKIAENKVTGAVASVVFPLATLVYLYLGFFRGLWHPGWMIFPVTGILFGVFSAVYSSIRKDGH